MLADLEDAYIVAVYEKVAKDKLGRSLNSRALLSFMQNTSKPCTVD